MKKSTQLVPGLVFIAIVFVVIVIVNFNNRPIRVKLPSVNKQLATIPQDYYDALLVSGNQNSNYDVNFSPDASKVAYTVKNGNQSSVYINDQAGPWYDEVSNIGWTSDSKHFHYTAEKNNKWLVVIDNKEMPERFDSIGAIRFSQTDSSVYALENLTLSDYQYTSYVYFNGHKSQVYNNDDPTSIESSLIISPDNSYVAYYACMEGSGLTCTYITQDINGNTKSDTVYQDFDPTSRSNNFNPFGHGIVFSPNGKINVHISNLLISSFIVINNNHILVPGDAQYKYVFEPTFSSDGQGMAYTVEACNQKAYGSCAGADGKFSYVVYNNSEQKNYQDTVSLVFSPDGKSLAYWAKKDGKWVIVVNEKEFDFNLPVSAYGENIVFTPDSSGFYAIYSDDSGVHIIDKNGNKIGDTPSNNDIIDYPSFINNHFVYIEEDSYKNDKVEMALVVDGIKRKPYNILLPANLNPSLSTFSSGYNPDSLPIYTLTPDSKSIILNAVDKNQLWTIVEPIDNQ